MSFRPMKCPSCQKDVQVPDDTDSALCMYCGQSIICSTPVQITVGPNLQNLLGLAKTSLTAGNMEEAADYFTKVLEIDPSVSEAWLGKGKAVAWQSTLARIRIEESLAFFKNGVATSPEGKKEAVLVECVHETNATIVAVYNIAREHMLKFVELPDVWVDYLGQIMQLISALHTVSEWLPSDKVTLDNIVHLCKDNIEGVTYRDKFDNNMPKGWRLSEEYEKNMRAILDSAASRLKEIDPEYVPPNPEAKKPDNCFVVTATMGDQNHPTVLLMRQFRDQCLVPYKTGRTFIEWYYTYGPKVATLISGRPILKKLSYLFIVIPAHWLARFIMRCQKP